MAPGYVGGGSCFQPNHLRGAVVATTGHIIIRFRKQAVDKTRAVTPPWVRRRKKNHDRHGHTR